MKFLIIVLMFLSPVAIAQSYREPTDIELRAVYCTGVSSGTVTWVDQMLKDQTLPPAMRSFYAEMRNRHADNYNKLWAYISAKLNHIDARGLVEIRQKGESDALNGSKSAEESMKRCDKIDWLPF